jgi:hypothetical protein
MLPDQRDEAVFDMFDRVLVWACDTRGGRPKVRVRVTSAGPSEERGRDMSVASTSIEASYRAGAEQIRGGVGEDVE